jgi:ABC-type phosphate transport system substrate-binding protein
MTIRRRSFALLAAMAVFTSASLAVAGAPFSTSVAGATTDPSTLSGQGGSFIDPIVSKLVQDDSANLNPLFGAYTSTDVDSGIAAFVGSAPGVFSSDYAISERPLTASEAATAKANGRSFAYVPIAATPVAIVTLVPTEAWQIINAPTITSADFCQHMPLTTDLLGLIFGFDGTKPLNHWNDSRIDCPPGGLGGAPQMPIVPVANLDPSMANQALMSLLDSTPTSKASFVAGLTNPGGASLTTDPTPSEKWPYGQGTVPGGDQPFIGKLLAINAQTNAPSQTAAQWQLGTTGPISSVWTRAPLGVPWNLSTAAIQNAQGSFVPPSTAAAQAALADATVGATADPTTNNLVMFNPNASDAVAYNNYLMVESYLVVPTNGLSAAKAGGLAQLARFAVGPLGQQIVSSFGAAPDTAAMTKAGQAVAATLNAAAATSAAQADPTTTTTTTTTTSASGASPTTDTTGVGPAVATAGAGSGSSGSSSPSGLALTGTSNLPALVATGASLLALGALVRRRLRRRGVRS